MKADPKTTLRRHIVDVTRACAAFREAPARKRSPSCQGYHFNKDIPNRLAEQTRRSVYNWNPGPRRGKDGAIERHIAGKWHIIRARFLDDSLPRDTLWRLGSLVQQGYFLLGHRGLVHLSPRHQGLRTGQDKRRRIWVGVTGVVSRASFRRQPRSGQNHRTPFGEKSQTEK